MTLSCLGVIAEKSLKKLSIKHKTEKCGIETEIVIGVDGSPSCGVNETSKGSTCKNMSKNERAKGSGILIEQLRFALKERKISIPFYGIRYECLSEDLANIEKLLKD